MPPLTGYRVPAALVTAGMVVVLAVGGCALGRPSGDPGNHRLQELRADPIFSALPAGANLVEPIQETAAKYRAPAFQGAGYDGPAVTATFTSNQPANSVFSFYAKRAAEAGWISNGNKNALGYPESWSKTYQGGVAADLILTGDINTSPGPVHTYVLNASAPAKG